MSKPVVVSIPHELGRAEARRRIEEGVGRLTSQIGAVGDLKQHWHRKYHKDGGNAWLRSLTTALFPTGM